MKKVLLIILTIGTIIPAFAQSINVEEWRIHEGNEGILSQVHSHYGDPIAYNLKNIPEQQDAGWEKAPLDSKGMIHFGGNKASKLKTTKQEVDFTYFETLVNIPKNISITDFKVSFGKVDDGARAYVFNSIHPKGAYKGQIKFGESPVTENYKEFIVTGEQNRIVIVQFDDAGTGNNLQGAQVIVNGQSIKVQPAPLNLDGQEFVMENVANGKILAVNGINIGKNGTSLHSWPKSETPPSWKFVPSGDGENMYYIISTSPQTGAVKYLEVGSDEVGQNGGLVQMWESNGGASSRYGANQVWITHKNSDGNYSIMSAHANGRGAYALELSGSDVNKNGGGKIQIWRNQGAANQKWKMIPVN